MIKSIQINWEVLGAQFANLSDEEQGAFFNGLSRELKHWESCHQKQMQGSMIADKINDQDKKELETFLGMLWFKD